MRHLEIEQCIFNTWQHVSGERQWSCLRVRRERTRSQRENRNNERVNNVILIHLVQWGCLCSCSFFWIFFLNVSKVNRSNDKTYRATQQIFMLLHQKRWNVLFLNIVICKYLHLSRPVCTHTHEWTCPHSSCYHGKYINRSQRERNTNLQTKDICLLCWQTVTLANSDLWSTNTFT